jgi:uncharacterized membrane protein
MAATETTTIRASARTRDLLREISTACEVSLTEAVGRAVEAYYEELFWNRVSDGFEALRSDPGAWGRYRADLDAWDGVLADGLPAERST